MTTANEDRTKFMLAQILRCDASFGVSRSAEHVEAFAAEWCRAFAEFPDATVAWAVSRYIDGGEAFAPRIGQLRCAIISKALYLMEPETALRMVVERRDRSNKAAPMRDQEELAMECIDCMYIWRAVLTIGWRDIVAADTPASNAAWKRQFIDAYRAELSRAKNPTPETIQVLSAQAGGMLLSEPHV